MKAVLEEAIDDIKVELIASGGGVFEISKSGQLIYSKKQTGIFPDESLIIDLLQ
ncbi:MAG: hypothetical protein DWQ10_06485 [Calditrichaeota bacterium]|nr:MAG: hypothetical protein DWQ10_06485 [Calditrichota bacterium]